MVGYEWQGSLPDRKGWGKKSTGGGGRGYVLLTSGYTDRVGAEFKKGRRRVNLAKSLKSF